jgi:hypothetical protein
MTTAPLVATLLAGLLMLAAGLAKKRLAWRSPDACPRCGRTRETCSCRNRTP